MENLKMKIKKTKKLTYPDEYLNYFLSKSEEQTV